MMREKRRMAVFYYIFYAQTRLEGKKFILLHPSKHWRLAAFTFYKGKSYWRAGDLDQGINLEWPYLSTVRLLTSIWINILMNRIMNDNMI